MVEREAEEPTVELILPADSEFGVITGKWMRMPDRRIRAVYTAEEFATALAVAGYTEAAARVRELTGCGRT